MKSSAIWSLLLIIAVVASAIYYFGFRTPAQEGALNTNENSAENEMAEGEFSGSLFELADRGGDYVCTFSHSSAAAESTGTVYIAGANLRGDFSSKVQGMAVESHMIRKDGFLYTWSPMAPQGLKIPEAAGEGDGDAGMQGQYADMSQAYSYNCEAWTPEDTKFALPAITFQAI